MNELESEGIPTMCSRPIVQGVSRAAAVLCALTLYCAAPPAALLAQNGTSPAVPVPNQPQPRWGILEPRAILGDTTYYLFNYEPGCNEPFWFDIDMEGGLLFAATGSTFEIWDARSNGAAPFLRAELCKPVLGLWKKSDTDFYAVHVAVAPAATPGALPEMAVVGLEGGMGVVAIDVSNPSAPRKRYQDDDVSTLSLDATRINGRDYAIVSRSSRDIAIYDLTTAKGLNVCIDRETPGCGVFVGVLKHDGEPIDSVSRVSTAGRFVVLRKTTGAVVYDLLPALDGDDVRFVSEKGGPMPHTVEAWIQDGKLYFATVTNFGGASPAVTDIYRVNCAYGSGSCNPTLVASLATPGGPASNGSVVVTDTLTHSDDLGVSYLYVGSTKDPGGGPQREYLFDLTDLGNPTELTPQIHPDGYWGWYYEPNPTGFRHVAPRMAMVHDGYAYRSAYSILDVHEIVGSRPPVARFDLPPGPVLGGQSVQFTDRSVRGPTEWEWQFFDGVQLLHTTTQRNPTWTVPETAPYPHDYRVSLQASNAVGSDTIEKTLTVYDPAAPPLEIEVFRPLLFCIADICPGTVGTPIEFALQVEGSPESYDYDWDGDGTFEVTGRVSPVGQHTYWQPGNYRPRIRVSAAESTQTMQIEDVIQVEFDPDLVILIDAFESGGFNSWSTVRGSSPP